MPPPIRYPLPTLIALLLLCLVAWRGADTFRRVRDAVSARWHRAVAGPALPASASPRVVAGAMVRQALLLRDGTPISSRPGSKTTDSIARRMFVDIYDVWPIGGTPAHDRVGTRLPLGWIAASDCLEWDTRLVIRPVDRRLALADAPDGPPIAREVGATALPVLSWSGDWVEVGVWESDRPWSAIARRAWTKLGPATDGRLGVLLADSEMPALLTLSLASADPSTRDLARLRAVLGRIVPPPSWSATDVNQAIRALPAGVFRREDSPDRLERIAARNARHEVEAAWSGQVFQFVPVDELP